VTAKALTRPWPLFKTLIWRLMLFNQKLSNF